MKTTHKQNLLAAECVHFWCTRDTSRGIRDIPHPASRTSSRAFPASRAIAARTHTPKLIFVVLLLLGLVCSLLAGYVLADTQTRNVMLYVVAFAVVVTLTIYVIFDLDYPRFGLIQLDFADQALIDLLAGMK